MGSESFDDQPLISIHRLLQLGSKRQVLIISQQECEAVGVTSVIFRRDI